MRRTLTFISAVAVVSLSPLAVLAQVEVPGGADAINVYISKLYTFGIGIGGILAVLMIVMGGIYYSVSGAVDKKSEGKDMITSALLGLLILLGSYVILQTVNPVLTTLKNPTLDKTLISTSTLAYSCTEQNTTRECGANESPIGADGKCQCYTPTADTCPSAAFAACPIGPVKVAAGGYVTIPKCATQITTANIAFDFLLKAFDANTVGSCSGEVKVDVTKFDTDVEYYQYPYYPEDKTPSTQQCLTYAIRVSDANGKTTATYRTSLEGLKKCQQARN
jgi:hypothetical protein